MQLNILLFFLLNYYVTCYKYNLRKHYNVCDDINCNYEHKIFNDCIDLCSYKGNKINCFTDCLSKKTSIYKKCCYINNISKS